eukprot:SAG25_NODE_342_length_9432_cov_2.769305_7_plen_77_part_00
MTGGVGWHEPPHPNHQRLNGPVQRTGAPRRALLGGEGGGAFDLLDPVNHLSRRQLELARERERYMYDSCKLHTNEQ